MNFSKMKNIINNKKMRIVFTILFILYLVYLLYLVFISSYYGRTTFHRSYNLVPLKTIVQYFNSLNNISVVITNILGNIVAFIPMGFLLPLVVRYKRKFIGVTISVFFASFAIEIFQYIIAVGVCDIDDLILNVIGGIIGFFLYTFIYKLSDY